MEEILLVLKESAVAISTERLENAYEDVRPEMTDPLLAVITLKLSAVEVMIEKMLANGFRKVTFGTIKK